MNSSELLRSEVTHYLILADTLKERYGELDDETLKDTLEGISDLPEAVAVVIRSSLDDEAYIIGLKSRLEDLQARLARLRDRYEKKRALVRWAHGRKAQRFWRQSYFVLSVRFGGKRTLMTTAHVAGADGRQDARRWWRSSDGPSTETRSLAQRPRIR